MESGLLKTHSGMLSLISRAFDVLIIWACGLLAFELRFDAGFTPRPITYATLVLIGGLIAAALFPALGLYRSWRAKRVFAPLARALIAWLVVFSVVLVLLVTTKQAQLFSRLWLTEWALLTGAVLVVFRWILHEALRAMRRRGYNSRRVVIVGTGLVARNLVQRTDDSSWSGYRLAGVFNCDDENVGAKSVAGRSPQPISRLEKFVRRMKVDEVWVALPLEQVGEIKRVLVHLEQSATNICYVPDFLGVFLLNHGLSERLGMPFIDLTTSPMFGVNRALKFFEDRILAAIILILISPLMLAIALAIKLTSRGPVLFKQKRHGWDSRPTRIYKFRTMVLHSEKGGRVTQAGRYDSRVTKLGRVLRRTSLDELPQFFNVLQGRMSIVGPRPHACRHNDEFKFQIERYMLRHCVKPGITGWAQINGYRGETDTVGAMRKRVEHDLFYIEHWSLWFDLRIIFLTIFKGFVHKNAY